jgi:hypothetical protein
MCLAIAIWEKGASWRAQGWAGENGEQNDLATNPPQVAATNQPHPNGSENERAGPRLGAARAWEGEFAVGHQSSPAPKRT